MYKVGICGHLAFGEQFNSGQKDKTRSVYSALVKEFGEDKVTALDTRGWSKNPVAFALKCRKLISECENVIMLPGENALKIIPALFEAFNIIYKRKLHYVVVGGWLVDHLKKNPSLIKPVKKLDCIYVELKSMKANLESMGFSNIYFKPKFRETNAISPDELYIPDGEPYRVCTFSRICYSKGIEDAIEAVRYVNSTLGRTVYNLDIYGLPDEEYIERFEELKKGFEPFINYKGYVQGTAASSKELHTCFAMLFPTWYEGEGFAGTVVDAFCAGVPVIATDWKYNEEVITHGKDGIIYSVNEREKLKEILLEVAQSPDTLNNMRADCLSHAEEFSPRNGVKVIVDQLK